MPDARLGRLFHANNLSNTFVDHIYQTSNYMGHKSKKCVLDICILQMIHDLLFATQNPWGLCQSFQVEQTVPKERFLH